MRNNVVLLIVLLLILLPPISTLTCTAQNVPIEPYEIWITMDQEFIKGNTTKEITITNNKDENINFTWYIENPSPASKRQNRTNITDLSWVDIEPRWYNTSPGDIAHFYIYLNIPETEENLNQNWEVWATFRLGSSGFVNWVHAIRVYIDTPKKTSDNENPTSDKILDRNIIIPILIMVIAAVITAIFLYKKKKT